MADSFFRQIRLFAYFVIGVSLGCVSVSSFAAGGLIGYCNSSNFTSGCYSSATLQAKSQCGNTTNMRTFGSLGPLNCNSQYCLQQQTYLIDVNGSTSTSDDCFASTVAYYCPDGKDWDSATFSCIKADPCKSKSGQAVDDGSIDFGDGANKNLWMSFSTRSDSNYVGQTFCSGGCTAGVTKEVGTIGYSDSKSYYGTFNANYSGQSCGSGQSEITASTTPAIQKRNTPEYDCVKAGKGYGYFNGSVVCTTANPSKATDTKTKTTTNADGTKQDIKTDTSVKCDGTVCITTTTTTTTSYNSSGSATGTTTTTDSTSKPDPAATGSGQKGDETFCSQNPDSPMCKTGKFGETCTAEPSCDGDPVQCATARATWKTRCALEPTQEVVAAGQTVLNGDQAATDALKHTAVAMSSVDTSGGGASGSCPADKVISIYGQYSLKVPFSSICAGADLMRVALLALASFTAAMILIGGIK